MTSLYTLAVEAALARDDTQSCPAAPISGPCETADENAWRTFRERLLEDVDGSEWSESGPPQVVSDIVEIAQQALSASSCTVYLANGQGHRILYDPNGKLGERRLSRSRIDRLSAPAARAVERRAALMLNTAEDWAAHGIASDGLSPDDGTRVLCVPIEADRLVLGAVEMARRGDETPFTEREFDSARVIGALAGITIENARLRQSVEESYRSTIRALASAIDAKDPYTCGHSQSVAQYSMICGMVLNLDTREIRTLETAALLHDIGKIGIDDAILRKPRGLTDAERAIVRDHPVIGAAIVKDVGALNEVVGLILHHHENLDGSGYPHGLQGDDIPLGARIIRVADAFDSMTTDRPYRRSLTINEAMTELLRCRGTQFCPTALDAFAVGFTRYCNDLPRRPRVLERRERLAIPVA